MKRLCDNCKKPMFTSLAGEWIGGKFVDVHVKCNHDWWCKKRVEAYSDSDKFSLKDLKRIRDSLAKDHAEVGK
jgi:hypothetical protein